MDFNRIKKGLTKSRRIKKAHLEAELNHESSKFLADASKNTRRESELIMGIRKKLNNKQPKNSLLKIIKP